jgi:NAD(P)-dependent dehydrogenase (short-subunit alcohol dehydrogenase family)
VGGFEMGNRLEGKVAIVTGAGSIGPGWGNGKAAAVLYAREGAKVFAIDCNLSAAEETKRIIENEGGECTVSKVDVSKSQEVRAAVEKCIEIYGRIDILHKNVGILEVGGPVEISEENWDRLIDINVKGMFLTCKYCIPYMEKQGRGVIVNISSIASMRYPGYPSVSYSASKGAVNQLTQNIAVQYAGKGIRANCVAPGLINSPMVIEGLKNAYGDGGVEEMIKKRDSMSPMKKQGDAWDVAYASLFLASDEAKYITGIQLVVDGGSSCKTD